MKRRFRLFMPSNAAVTSASQNYPSSARPTQYFRSRRKLLDQRHLYPRPARERLRRAADVAAVFENPADLVGGLFGIGGQIRGAHRQKPVAAHGVFQRLAGAAVVFSYGADGNQSRIGRCRGDLSQPLSREHLHQASAVK